jgi:hypothetical protein
MLGVVAATRRLGEGVPTGRGVTFAHVEGSPGRYMPDVNGGGLAGVTITGRSGDSEPFGHATSTASVIYGRGGLAPGVTDVWAYTSTGWARDVLSVGKPIPPTTGSPRVHTHSWIADGSPVVDEVLLRVDHLIDHQDRLVIAGVNNGRDTPVPALLASSYNAIAVGTAQGQGASSGGPTVGTWPGRSKPDLVGATGLTSFATPQVAAIAGRLLEAADAMPFFVDHADRAEVIKAILMAGAAKPWGWRPIDGRPLDDHYGAGVVHLDNALRIQSAGPTTPGQAERFGWWFGQLLPGDFATFTLPVEPGDGPLSAVLVWHRRVDGRSVMVTEEGKRRAFWQGGESLAEFDLLASLVADDTGPAEVLALSRSKLDNVEHVFTPGNRLTPGGRPRVVRLDVLRPKVGGRGEGADGPWEAALAWRIGGWDFPDGPARRDPDVMLRPGR